MISKFIQVVPILCFGLLFVWPVKSRGEGNWNSLEAPPFIIFYAENDKIFANETASLLKIFYEELSGRIGLESNDIIRVFLSPSEKTFNELTNNLVPDWGEGVADPVKNVIVLKSPSQMEDQNHFPKLVKHELVHILIGHSAKNPHDLPKWFNEGIASYLSADERVSSGEAISKALLSDSIIPLDEIDGVLRFQRTKAALAYEESYSFTVYLVENYGFESMVNLIQELQTEKTFAHAFRDVYGIDLFEAEIAWYQYMEKKYRWHFLLDFENFLWISILLLFILVFLAIKLRNRRTLKKWDKEERWVKS